MPACAACAPLRPRGSYARSATPHRRVRLDHPRGREAIRIADAILYQPADCLARCDGTKIDYGAKNSLCIARASSGYFSGRYRTQHNPNCSDPHRPGDVPHSAVPQRSEDYLSMAYAQLVEVRTIASEHTARADSAQGEGRKRARPISCAHGQSQARTRPSPAQGPCLETAP